jgi:hypothetical protein
LTYFLFKDCNENEAHSKLLDVFLDGRWYLNKLDKNVTNLRSSFRFQELYEFDCSRPDSMKLIRDTAKRLQAKNATRVPKVVE